MGERKSFGYHSDPILDDRDAFLRCLLKIRRLVPGPDDLRTLSAADLEGRFVQIDNVLRPVLEPMPDLPSSEPDA